MGAQQIYVPPRLENENGFLIDTRSGQRELVEEFKPEGTDKIIRFEIADEKDRAMIGQFFVDLYNKSCSMFSCLIPPRLENENGFLIDTRSGQRELVEEFKPEGTDKIIRFEIADEKDRAMIGQFFVDLYNKSCSMFSCLNPSYEDTAPFVFNILDHVLDKRASIIAFDGNKMIGFSLNNFHTPEELAKLYPRGLCEENPIFEIKDDYGKDIDKGPFPTRKGNQIESLCDEAYSQTGKFLPKDIKNFAVAEAVGVHPEYFRIKVFVRMMQLSEEIFRKKDCNYLAGYCAVTSSLNYCNKRGYKTVSVFPYDRFKDNNEVVFKDLADKAHGLYVTILKL
uniref:Uncharacterized protein n=1 Tax=Panagrolaimus sp. ES5 TaxID=591445 RepID=A0AC34F5X8_9BILA